MWKRIKCFLLYWRSRPVKISGLEAHYLLFALDHYLGVDAHILQCKDGYTREGWQSLRDRLFAAHEHPPEDYED